MSQITDMTVENSDQRALRLWLAAGLRIPEVVALKGDAGYLLNNMIAKYTLAADCYVVSVEAEKTLAERGVDFELVYSRRTFYGKQGGRNPFIYEHAIPAGVLREALLSTGGDEEAVRRILISAGPVAVLLRNEDDRLRQAGLSARMPPEWRVGDDPLKRYRVVGIKLSDKVLNVEGAICR